MKLIKACLGGGLLVSLLLGIPLFLFFQVWNFAAWVAEVVIWKVSANPTLNSAFYLLIILMVICILGWVFRVKIFRDLIDAIMSRVPIASTILKFIPTNEEMEGLFEGKKEVRVRWLPGIWVRGIITKTWQEGGKKWHRIYFAGCPFPPGGYCFEVEDETLIKVTGKDAGDYFANIMSYGTRSDEGK